MKNEDQAKRIETLQTVINEVSAFVLTSFQTGQYRVMRKNDGSEVTEIDRAAELQAKTSILSHFSDDGFLGEEYGEVEGTSGWRWVVDPIDGTASFTRGVPLFGTLIGLEYKGKAIAGAANLPAIGESISAVKGEGAWRTTKESDTRIKANVSDTHSLEEAMICTTTFDYYRQTNSEAMFYSLLDHAGSTRGWSDCYAFLLVCTGRVDALIEPLLFPWDVIPWLPIIEESGGIYTSIGSGGMVASPKLHHSLYDVLHANITN